MKVEKILKEKGSQVYTIHVEAIVSDALQIMDDKKIGALVVVDSQEKIQGIMTERDIMRACYRSQANVKGCAVREVMTPRDRLIIARPDDDVEYVSNIFTDSRIRHLTIIDAQGKLSGIVSIGDVVKVMLSHKDHEIKYLKDYIESKYPV